MKCPIHFVCSKEDTFVKHKHTLKLYVACKSDKRITYIPGEHNECRPDAFYEDMADYLAKLDTGDT